jgi:voltage-gated potassium channel
VSDYDHAVSPEAAEKLERWNTRARPAIILAALIPIVATVAERRDGVLLVIDFVSWFVFLADLIVHMHLTRKYLKRGIGMFDLGVVVATFPWYIIPGLENADILLVARIARVARLFLAGTRLGPLRRLFERLGRAFLYGAVLLVVCSVVVQEVEGGKHGFESIWDSLWWGVVTFTTVGYGDLVPESAAGRAVATVLMLGGLALLGALAGSLAAFLRIQDTGEEEPGDQPETPADVATEVASLREQVAELNRRLAALQVSAERLSEPEKASPP